MGRPGGAGGEGVCAQETHVWKVLNAGPSARETVCRKYPEAAFGNGFDRFPTARQEREKWGTRASDYLRMPSFVMTVL
jgi:hypothetical protein